MSFASPVFFWALVSLIPLCAIYLLKVRPTRKPTNAWFLWEDIFQENRATSLFQRFRDLFSLLLMGLAFLAIVLALARPDLSGDRQYDLILLIDNSASMSANDSSGVRLDQAKKVAADIVKALNGTQRCSVAVVSNEARFLSNLTDNPQELLTAIESVAPSLLPSKFDVLEQFAAEKQAKKQVEDRKDDAQPVSISKRQSRVILISDGCGDRSLPEGIELMKVGSGDRPNIGLVACDMRRLPGGSGRVGVFFQVASTWHQQVEAELVLGFDSPDAPTKFVPLEVQPGVNPPEVFELDDAQAGQWYFRLSAGRQDALRVDDVAYLTLPPRRPISIAVVAQDRYFYENCVQAFSQNDGLLKLSDASQSAGLLIGAGDFAVPAGYDGDLLVFQPSGVSPFWQDLGEEIEVTEARTVDDGHPVIRHIDPSLMPFVGARRLAAPPGAEVLVKAEDDTPLIYRATHAGRSAVVLNFDPLASDFYLSAWFPVVVYSSVTHLAGRSDEVPATWRTGQTAHIPGVQGGEKSLITTPDGATVQTESTRTAPLKQAGFYELTNNSGTWPTSCSLLSTGETLIDNSNINDSGNPVNRGASPTAWLTLIAIAILAAESMLYQRRKVG